MKRKWIHAVGIFFVIILVSLYFWHQLKFSDIEEVQNKVIRQNLIGFGICDLDSDGNDEILVTTTTGDYIVTLQKHRLIPFPVPLFDVKMNFPRGHRLIGRTMSGEIAVAEWLSSGKWQVQVLTHSGNSYAIGDVDGSGKDDDAFVILGSRLLWFQRQTDGLWKYAGEIRLPVGKSFAYLYGVEKWGVKIDSGRALLPLIFQDGLWEVGKPNEQVYLFRANWDGRDKSDHLLVRYLPKSDEMTLFLRKGGSLLALKTIICFDGWQTVGIVATNELDGRQWHLLLAQTDSKRQMRILDCFFTSKGWQVNEITKWQVTFVPDHAELHVGDANGDGKVEIVVTGAGIWLLRQTKKAWTIRLLTHRKGQYYHEWRPLNKIGKRLWFSRMVGKVLTHVKGLGVQIEFSEIGTFQTNGQWKPEFRWRGIVNQPKQLTDLDGDGYPEFLGLLEGRLISQQPVLWRRLKNGDWKPVILTSPSLYRLLWRTISINPSFFVDADQLLLAQWHGKKWFVIFWDDGFMQAVTLKRH